MALSTKSLGFMSNLRRWAFSASGFNQYGLYYDDLLEDTEDVKEAIKRVPKHIMDERNYRSIRALQLSMQKIKLPKDQWTTYEQDRANRYLSPIVEQVRKEREEREQWNANY